MKKTQEMKSNRRGLTMIELLIVIAILAILMLILLWSLRGQTYKARDAKRKADLDAYTTMFEDYFNDNDSYPALGSLDNCNSTDLAPHVKKILCDPGPGTPPYFYWVDDDGLAYAICANLENKNDPAIYKSGCTNGCGTDGAYNYCMVVGGGVDLVGGEYGAGQVQVGEGLDVGEQACFSGSPSSVCNSYDKEQWSCEYTFNTSDCDGLCETENYSTCVLK